MLTIAELMSRFPHAGRVEWIGVARRSRGAIEPRADVVLVPGTGIEGEHHCKRRLAARRVSSASDEESESASGPRVIGPKRQVTLLQHEHLPLVAALLRRENLSPELLRRNIAVSGVNVLALKACRFRVGDAVLEGSGPCEPCSRMEEVLGPGGYNAMRGHGGITARVVEGGVIRIGDALTVIADSGSREIE